MRKRNDALMEQLALHLVGGGTCAAFAKTHGVSARSCYHWCKLPEFHAMVTGNRAQVLDRIYGRLIAGLDSAVDTINELSRKAGDERVRLSAARGLIADVLIMKEVNINDERFKLLEGRLTAIEAPKDAT